MPKRELQHPTLGGAPGFSRAIEVSGGRTIYFAGQAPNDVGHPDRRDRRHGRRRPTPA